MSNSSVELLCCVYVLEAFVSVFYCYLDMSTAVFITVIGL